MDLTGRNIVLGVTGGIAAYKSAELVSRLRHLGANVHVIMTRNATEFVSPLTFQTLSANQVVTDTFQAPEYWNVEHVALAKLAEVFVIAPATANIIAKMASGIADDINVTFDFLHNVYMNLVRNSLNAAEISLSKDSMRPKMTSGAS